MRVTSTSTTSPSFMKTGGVRFAPTPPGVPVTINWDLPTVFAVVAIPAFVAGSCLFALGRYRAVRLQPGVLAASH